MGSGWGAVLGALAGAAGLLGASADERPVLEAEFVFPLEAWHNHASCLVETPRGDLLVCWFHGSGERTADDVKIEGAWRTRGARDWGPRFTMADTPGYPDTNPAMFIDPRGRLWLLWPTILDNRWESALMKYRIAAEYRPGAPPRWETDAVLHVTPGDDFAPLANAYWDAIEPQVLAAPPAPDQPAAKIRAHFAELRTRAADKLHRRLGWMTRAHPLVLDGRRLIVPLYSDGFDCSLMAITDDWGATWRTSVPLLGGANIQPSLVQRSDGSLYALMRDNGPPPKRLMQSESRDGGEHWAPVTDSAVANPGSGAEVIRLRNGHWALVGNDTERGRHRLTVLLSDDEGRTWKWRRSLEDEPSGADANSFSYPSLIQTTDGMLHATYSYHLNKRSVPKPPAGEKPRTKTIKHARFTEAWVRQDGPPAP